MPGREPLLIHSRYPLFDAGVTGGYPFPASFKGTPTPYPSKTKAVDPLLRLQR